MTEVQERQQRGRAMNAVQEFLVHRLLFPKVYLGAEFRMVRRSMFLPSIERAQATFMQSISCIKGRMLRMHWRPLSRML